ncbi:MAG: hypothetical protein AAFX81_17380 [Pseudomonadota bacterium]
MERERYPGERRGLRLFLEGLEDVVAEELGQDSLLYRRIRAALGRGDLVALRDARQMFNHQAAELKRKLSLSRAVPSVEAVTGWHPEPAAPTPRGATIIRLPQRRPELDRGPA